MGADGWALFDTLVVSASVLLLIVNDDGSGGGNSWMKQMRVLRAFRLLRLLGKMGDLKKIVTAVAISLIPTLQALVSLSQEVNSSNGPLSDEWALTVFSIEIGVMLWTHFFVMICSW